MAKYRKKPVVIEAVRWRGYSNNLGITTEPPEQPIEITMDNMGGIKWDSLPKWLPKVGLAINPGDIPSGQIPSVPVGAIFREGESLWIGTLEGSMRADPGDWIIQGIKGELYPCKPDIFAATYEPA
jgi:hypothetical protein